MLKSNNTTGWRAMLRSQIIKILRTNIMHKIKTSQQTKKQQRQSLRVQISHQAGRRQSRNKNSNYDQSMLSIENATVHGCSQNKLRIISNGLAPRYDKLQ